jgi:hypothetical protein
MIQILAIAPALALVVYLLFGPMVTVVPSSAAVHLHFSAAPAGEHVVGHGVPYFLAGRLGLLRWPVVEPVKIDLQQLRPQPLDKTLLGYAAVHDYCRQRGMARSRDEREVNTSLIESAADEPPFAAFRIDRTEVTRGAYAIFLADIQGRFPDFPAPLDWVPPDEAQAAWPVSGVSWYEAELFALWAGKELPSDRQWRIAASERGATPWRYPWGNHPVDHDRAVYCDVSSSRTPRVVDSHPLGRTPAGVADLAGNLWEWTRDLAELPGEPPLHGYRWVRGGSYMNTAGMLAAGSNHDIVWAATRLPQVGFRCVVTLDEQPR